MVNTNITLDMIYKELEFLKNKVINIEEHILNSDTNLSDDDKEAIDEVLKEEKERKLFTKEQVFR